MRYFPSSLIGQYKEQAHKKDREYSRVVSRDLIFLIVDTP